MPTKARKMRKVEEDEIYQDLKQSVFVMIIARCKRHITKTIIKEYPGIITIFRSDGKIGFPGGGLEQKDVSNNIITNEDLKNTVIRECIEEIGYEIKFRNNLKKFTSYVGNGYQVTSFIYFVTEIELNNIYENYHNVIGRKFNSDEIFGLNKLIITNRKIYNEILKQNFKTTSKKDFIEFIENSGMLE